VGVFHITVYVKVPNQVAFPKGEFHGLRGNWDHRLADLNCWAKLRHSSGSATTPPASENEPSCCALLELLTDA